MPARLAFLWHFHQPPYRDPVSGEPILPWVRLHAGRAYYDMGRMLEKHPGVQCTANFVPSLLAQLEACAAGTAPDRFQTLSTIPPGDLAPAQRELMVRNFFMVDWETCVRPLPRFWELLHARGRDLRTVNLAHVARNFTAQDLLDLSVLFQLAWFGFSAHQDEPRLMELRKKGRGFTEEDRAFVLALSVELAGKIVPLWKRLQARGQVEITVTPYYHPILPLLCDSDSARRAMPTATLPTRFAWPDDAREQVRRALEFAESRFGEKPRGMWPAEGSVSPEAADIFAGEGVQWICSDEDVLLRSLAADARREQLIYRPYRYATAKGALSMAFRDKTLSDLLGFTYARNPAGAAARDFLGHVTRIGAGASKGEEPLVTVALDGENPWEHYPESGKLFLEALYRGLDGAPGVTTVRLGDVVGEGKPLARLHSGSWIDSNFRIWIGHAEDNAAWELLGAARREVESAQNGGADPAAVAAAREALFAAEASDWFWWYGDDFHTENAAEFDALFRGYVKRSYIVLGKVPPARLETPIALRARERERAVREPSSFIAPKVDGKALYYFDWAGAGLYRPAQGHGSMHRGTAYFDVLYYGFDLTHLYLRLDPGAQAGEADGEPSGVQIALLSGDREIAIDVELARKVELKPRLGVRSDLALAGSASPPGKPLGRAVFEEVLEVELPFGPMGVARGERLGLAVRVLRGGVELERLPRYGYLGLLVPTEDFERVHWKV